MPIFHLITSSKIEIRFVLINYSQSTQCSLAMSRQFIISGYFSFVIKDFLNQREFKNKRSLLYDFFVNSKLCFEWIMVQQRDKCV